MNKRKPVKTPGKATSEFDPNDDFTLVASLYYDAVYFYVLAEKADEEENFYLCGTYKRAALLASFSFYESLINQAAFGHAASHSEKLPAFELDVLEEKETKLMANGKIQRVQKFYPTESRFKFISYFLSGEPFDCGGSLWKSFQDAQKLRNKWAHPKPPFDTSSLLLADVKQAIISVRSILVELSSLMGLETPLWLVPFENVASIKRKELET